MREASTASGDETPQAVKQLKATANQLVNIGCVNAIPTGDLAEEIADYASDNDLDMIVMGTHGRGEFRRAVVGSVADEVVRAIHPIGIDISDRTTQEITFEEIQESEYVITMGCSDDTTGKSAAEVDQTRFSRAIMSCAIARGGCRSRRTSRLGFELKIRSLSPPLAEQLRGRYTCMHAKTQVKQLDLQLVQPTLARLSFRFLFLTPN